MTDIVEFLKDQMNADEQLARAACSGGNGHWHVGDVEHWDNRRIEADEPGQFTIYDEGGHDEHQARHIARHDPARVLADVKAKQALLAQADDMREMAAQTEAWFLNDYADGIERNLAAPYAGQPGFKDEWALP